MTRKDLIIIAVLVNAGLMSIFFISALKSDHHEESDLASSSSSTAQISEMKVAQAAPADEIDQILKQHSMASPSAPMLSMTTTESGMPMSAPLTMGGGQAPNFADDLKAISMPEMSGVHQVAQTVPVEKPAASTQMEVKVKKGDVLERIARKHGVSVDELMKANQLSSSQLKIGQVLKIPGKTAPKSEPAALAHAPASAPAPAAASDENAQYYIVKNGDNPWTIAVKNHIKVEDLLRLNNLNEEKARRLKPGDKLRVK